MNISNEIHTWLAITGISLIALSTIISVLSIKPGVKPSEVLLVPGWVISREINKHIKPRSILFVKVTATLGIFLFMLSVLLLVFKAITA